MTGIIERPATTGPITAPNWGLTKFLDPLRVPPALRPHSWRHDAITIPMVTKHQRLHSQLPPSTLWTYADISGSDYRRAHRRTTADFVVERNRR